MNTEKLFQDAVGSMSQGPGDGGVCEKAPMKPY